MTATAQPPARKPRRVPLVAILIVTAFFVGVFGASRISTAMNSDTLAWGTASGPGGHRFERTRTATMTVVYVEVWWPACIEQGDYAWLTPDVADLPWSVTITLRTNDHYTAKCGPPATDGRLPVVGTYLSPLAFPVLLGEALGNRSLLDGSTFPATQRFHA
jgi:hypothetical protein